MLKLFKPKESAKVAVSSDVLEKVQQFKESVTEQEEEKSSRSTTYFRFKSCCGCGCSVTYWTAAGGSGIEGGEQVDELPAGRYNPRQISMADYAANVKYF